MSEQIARLMRRLLSDTIEAKRTQGHDLGTIPQRLAEAKDLTTVFALVDELRDVPMRPDWPYHEPDDLAAIQAASDPAADWSTDGMPEVVGPGLTDRIEASFLASVCGCVLGKPIEVQASAQELGDAAARSGTTWPLDGYVPEAMLAALGRRARDWEGSVQGRIVHVPADDDLNFRILAMLLLERLGRSFEGADLVEIWSQTLPFEWVWASNRTLLLKAALYWWRPGDEPLGPRPIGAWGDALNPYDEDCGAVIRVDPYAYACPATPGHAAALAWRDANVTHRRTGVYAAMFQAAALSAAFSLRDPIEIFTTALRYIPRRSRLYEHLVTALGIVAEARDWASAYAALETALGTYGHCQIYFELGTVINSVRFAEDTGHGIGLQVSQGLDTDSFGASAGAILGARFGPTGLADAWLRPFRDDIRTTVAGFSERSLAAVAARMAALPRVGHEGTGRPAFAGDP